MLLSVIPYIIVCIEYKYWVSYYIIRKIIVKYCHQAFDKEEELFKHAKEEHHKPVIKCHNCGMQFLHEKDRLHHIQEEKRRK